MKINIGKIIIISVVVFLVTWSLYRGLYVGVYKRSVVLNNPVILNGSLATRCGKLSRSRSTYSIDYSFYLNGVNYSRTDYKSFSLIGDKNQISGKFFPIVYERGNPSNSLILITKDDFEKLKTPYPDSLYNWVRLIIQF